MNKAVVVQYEEGWVSPKVLLKQKNSLAVQVVETAQKAGIPIVQDPELLDDLWQTGQGDFVREELFQIMASVLSFVYKTEEKEASYHEQ